MTPTRSKLSSGIAGLDDVLYGGFVEESTNLVRGGPGAGKTTIGLHFLIEGMKRNEKSLFITLGEPETNIRNNAHRLGLDISDLDILDLSPESSFFTDVESYDIFAPSDVEKAPTTKKITEKLEKEKPKRVFLDAITQLKFLSSDEYQYRKQALSFLIYLKELGSTVLFTTEHSQLAPDDDMQFMCDAILNLENLDGVHRLSCTKSRGSDTLPGNHTYKFTEGGIILYPNLVPPLKLKRLPKRQLSFGIEGMDKMLHGGIETGTISLIAGPSGAGKTTLGAQLAYQSAIDGYNSLLLLFEEEKEMLLSRSDQVNIPARKAEKEGNITINRIEPMLYCGDEFAHLASKCVEDSEASIVIIDSTSGYQLSLNDDESVSKLYALCKYLQKHGITVILIDEIQSITGDFQMTGNQLSYLADNIIFIRYLEMNGKMKKATGVIKKRLSDFEKTIREYEITKNGIRVSEPLDNIRGIFSGNPSWENSADRQQEDIGN